MKFLFVDHTLDTDRRELRRGSQPIAVEPQVFDLVTYLVQNRDHDVSKDEGHIGMGFMERMLGLLDASLRLRYLNRAWGSEPQWFATLNSDMGRVAALAPASIRSHGHASNTWKFGPNAVWKKAETREPRSNHHVESKFHPLRMECLVAARSLCYLKLRRSRDGEIGRAKESIQRSLRQRLV